MMLPMNIVAFQKVHGKRYHIFNKRRDVCYETILREGVGLNDIFKIFGPSCKNGIIDRPDQNTC